MPRRLLARVSAVVVTAALVLLVAGCGSGASTSASSSPALTIKNFTFTPSPLQAKVGQSITITNDDGTDHTATADDHSFDTGKFSAGSKTFTVTHAGTITYHCDVHNFMTGTIQVTAA